MASEAIDLSALALKCLVSRVQGQYNDTSIAELVSRNLLVCNAVGSTMLTKKGGELWALLLQTAREWCRENAVIDSGDAISILVLRGHRLLDTIAANHAQQQTNSITVTQLLDLAKRFMDNNLI